MATMSQQNKPTTRSSSSLQDSIRTNYPRKVTQAGMRNNINTVRVKSEVKSPPPTRGNNIDGTRTSPRVPTILRTRAWPRSPPPIIDTTTNNRSRSPIIEVVTYDPTKTIDDIKAEEKDDDYLFRCPQQPPIRSSSPTPSEVTVTSECLTVTPTIPNFYESPPRSPRPPPLPLPSNNHQTFYLPREQIPDSVQLLHTSRTIPNPILTINRPLFAIDPFNPIASKPIIIKSKSDIYSNPPAPPPLNSDYHIISYSKSYLNPNARIRRNVPPKDNNIEPVYSERLLKSARKYSSKVLAPKKSVEKWPARERPPLPARRSSRINRDLTVEAPPVKLPPPPPSVVVVAPEEHLQKQARTIVATDANIEVNDHDHHGPHETIDPEQANPLMEDWVFQLPVFNSRRHPRPRFANDNRGLPRRKPRVKTSTVVTELSATRVSPPAQPPSPPSPPSPSSVIIPEVLVTEPLVDNQINILKNSVPHHQHHQEQQPQQQPPQSRGVRGQRTTTEPNVSATRRRRRKQSLVTGGAPGSVTSSGASTGAEDEYHDVLQLMRSTKSRKLFEKLQSRLREINRVCDQNLQNSKITYSRPSLKQTSTTSSGNELPSSATTSTSTSSNIRVSAITYSRPSTSLKPTSTTTSSTSHKTYLDLINIKQEDDDDVMIIDGTF